MQWDVRAWCVSLAATTGCGLCQGPRGESASGVQSRQTETWAREPSPNPASLPHAPGNDWYQLIPQSWAALGCCQPLSCLALRQTLASPSRTLLGGLAFSGDLLGLTLARSPCLAQGGAGEHLKAEKGEGRYKCSTSRITETWPVVPRRRGSEVILPFTLSCCAGVTGMSLALQGTLGRWAVDMAGEASSLPFPQHQASLTSHHPCAAT